MNERAPARWILVLALGLALSCAGVPGLGPSEATPEERRAYSEARRDLERDPKAARRALSGFVAEHPRSALVPDAARDLADLELRQGHVERGLYWLELIVEDHPRSDPVEGARLDIARIQMEQGDAAAARDVLARARFTKLGPDEQREAYRLLADAADGDADRLRWLASVRSLDAGQGRGEAVRRIDREIDATVGRMDRQGLESAAEQLGRRIPVARVLLRLAELDLQAGEVEAATDRLAEAGDVDMTAAERAYLASLQERLELHERLATGDMLPTFAEVAELPPLYTDGARGTIGVVLPLTGNLAPFAEESLKGVLLAAKILSGEMPDVAAPPAALPGRDDDEAEGRTGPIRIVVRDTGGRPDRAAAAIRELSRDPDISAIVGPLLYAESEAAAATAEQEQIPLLALSTREEIAAGRRAVFRLRTTPHDEVRYLVDYAIEKLGAERFAMLYPKDNYGRGMRERFWAAVEERGKWVVGSAGYSPEATDFAEPIRSLIGYQLLTKSERGMLEKRSEALRRARRLPTEDAGLARQTLYGLYGPERDPVPPLVDFDALFIPDSHEKIVLIAPQLAFHDVSGVRLLGTGLWRHPDLLEIARKHVRGAVISAPFDPDSPFPPVERFVARYRQSYGETPDLFAAQAYDATTLVLAQLAAGNVERSGVREGLLRVQGFPGASGVLSFSADGNARKRPFLVGVGSRRLVPLD